MEQETKEERRRRQNRESMARAYASPEGRERLKATATRWAKSEQGKEHISKTAKAERQARPVYFMFHSMQARAKREQTPFSLTFEQVDIMCQPLVCSVTGCSLTWAYDGPGKNPWAPSIDRIDCSKGYETGNVRVVCWIFNLARSCWPDEVVIAMAKGLLANECS